MPVYAYGCRECGEFELRRAVVDAGADVACPTCGAPAGRRFTPPGLARTPPPVRALRDREERSAHAPDVVAGPTGRPLPWTAHGHLHGPPWAVGH